MLRSLCWIRRDLRLSDHSSLCEATHESDAVAVVFVFDSVILGALEDRDDRRVSFIHRSLQELDRKLRERGSALVVRYGDPIEVIPQLAMEMGCGAVFTARDYEPYARDRDAAVGARLASMGVEFRTCKDTVVFEGGEVLSQSGAPFRVYTPYARAWRGRFVPGLHADERPPLLEKLMPMEGVGGWDLSAFGFESSELWIEAGEDAGMGRLAEFRQRISAYAERRDFPFADGTSGLSVHLRFGTVSIRQAVRLALEVGTPGADKWLSELIWREFYQDILFHHPQVVSETFQPQYQSVEYPGLDEWFEAWKDGRTGYPIIDAAMRCFRATGWMHNRLRMVTASFLTKDLLIDYRRGEAYFARYLLDFDLASNNGGWQWAASVGADPQPYFRIFNPYLQSLKFDPEGDFIRRWVPELGQVDGKSIHSPGAEVVELGVAYPFPIVEHSVQREKAISLLATAARST